MRGRASRSPTLSTQQEPQDVAGVAHGGIQARFVASALPRSAGTRPGRDTRSGPQARNLLERRQHLIQTLITHGLVVGPPAHHVTISITGFSQNLP